MYAILGHTIGLEMEWMEWIRRGPPFSSHYAMAITHLMRYDIIGPPSARISQFNGPDDTSIQCVQYVCLLRIDWSGMGGLRSASVRAAPRPERVAGRAVIACVQ